MQSEFLVRTQAHTRNAEVGLGMRLLVSLVPRSPPRFYRGENSEQEGGFSHGSADVIHADQTELANVYLDHNNSPNFMLFK